MLVRSSLLLVSLAALSVRAEGDSEASAPANVVELKTEGFDAELSKGHWFVKFYAPWCGHCKKLAPEWEVLATQLKDTVHIGKVDCTVEEELAKKYGVRGYPSLMLFKKGMDPVKYQGARTVAAFTEYLEAQGALPPPPIELKYFDTRGRAEAIRLMLHELKLEFTDTRIPRDQWPEIKKAGTESGEFTFGQLPALTFGENKLVQSLTILRFLARRGDLYGRNIQEASLIDLVVDGLEDFRRKYGALVYSKNYKAEIGDYKATTLPTWLGYFERWLKERTQHPRFFVGRTLSFADILAFDLLDAHTRLFPGCLDDYQRLREFHQSVGQRNNLVQYLRSETRQNTFQNGVSAFLDNKANPAPYKE